MKDLIIELPCTYLQTVLPTPLFQLLAPSSSQPSLTHLPCVPAVGPMYQNLQHSSVDYLFPPDQ